MNRLRSSSRMNLLPIETVRATDRMFVLGAAWSRDGIGIAAMPDLCREQTIIRSYNNLALGPFGTDPLTTLQWVRLLPQIFCDVPVRLCLAGAIDRCALPFVEGAFVDAYGDKVERYSWNEVDAWASQSCPHIGVPNIPTEDLWSAKPIQAAAETALFAIRARSGGKKSTTTREMP